MDRSLKVAAVLTLSLLMASLICVSGQTKRAKFDPDGSFWILGEPPNEFVDFGGINLNAKRLRRLPSPGVQLNNGRNFRFKALNVSRENFTFTTVAVGGVSYTFAGRFLKGGVFETLTLDENTPVLEGVLTKLKSGKKVTEAKLKFVYFGGT
jgi:hypothetical protein